MPGSLFNKVAGLRLAILLKKTLAQVFSCEFCKISKNTFIYRTHVIAASEMCNHSITAALNANIRGSDASSNNLCKVLFQGAAFNVS